MTENTKKLAEDLEETFEKLILERNFTIYEMQGFFTNPKLSLMAGVAIGYKYAMQECQERLDSLLDRMTEKDKN